VTTSATTAKPTTPRPSRAGRPDQSRGHGYVLLAGARAAGSAAVVGLATVTICVVVGWIAAPHVGFGLTGVLRAAAVIWLAGHHVAVQVSGAGRIGMLPLGLVLLPGTLLWRAGRTVVRRLGYDRPGHAIGAAFAVAVPYSVICGVLAIVSTSDFAGASVPWAALCGFVVALAAAALGAVRAIGPWARLGDMIPGPARSVLAGALGSVGVLAATGCLATAMTLASHVRQFGAVYGVLSPGLVGGCLLLLAQLAYLPNAVIWAICYMIGPGFAVGAGTIVAATGSALGPLPAFPLLAAVPGDGRGPGPGWLAGLTLAVPYLAGLVGGLLVARTSPASPPEAATVRGFCAGALAGAAIGTLAVFAGGSVGDGRLAAVGPSAWQVGLVAVLELGISAAVSAGAATWRARAPAHVSPAAPAPRPVSSVRSLDADRRDGHVIFLDRWAADQDEPRPPGRPRGPSDLP
jgi:hypothetical protein